MLGSMAAGMSKTREAGGLQRRDAREILQKRLLRIAQRLTRVERLFGAVAEDIAILGDELKAGLLGDDFLSASHRQRRPSEVSQLKPCAIDLVSNNGRVTIVVGGLSHDLALTPLQIELVRVLSARTKDSPDHLVGFKRMSLIVHALRCQYPSATRRSVTVAISRLRQAFAPSLGPLIETARGAGYRVRLVAHVSAIGESHSDIPTRDIV